MGCERYYLQVQLEEESYLMADRKYTPPSMTRLQGADAVVIRQIILSLVQELEKIRARLDAGGL